MTLQKIAKHQLQSGQGKENHCNQRRTFKKKKKKVAWIKARSGEAANFAAAVNVAKDCLAPKICP